MAVRCSLRSPSHAPFPLGDDAKSQAGFQGFSKDEQPLLSGSDMASWDPVTQGQKGKLSTLPLQYTTCQREVWMGHNDPCGEERE